MKVILNELKNKKTFNLCDHQAENKVDWNKVKFFAWQEVKCPGDGVCALVWRTLRPLVYSRVKLLGGCGNEEVIFSGQVY